MKQLNLDLSHFRQSDLRLLLIAGLAEEAGRTPDGQVTSYRLTHLGRMLAERYSSPGRSGGDGGHVSVYHVTLAPTRGAPTPGQEAACDYTDGVLEDT